MTEKKSKPAEINTNPTVESVEDFINSFTKEHKRKDCYMLLEIMQKAVGEAPKMWGNSLIGFGQVKVKSPTTGREVDWLRIGFSPRHDDLSVYLGGNIAQQHSESLEKLGKYKIGHGCIIIKRLKKIKIEVLKEMIDASLKMNIVNK